MPEKILQKFWGYNSFRGNQKEIIENILFDKDVLAILPTGGGKSICYQLPALISDGVTVVISPLIALMQDQVDNLLKINISATFINSSLLPQEKRSILNGLIKNKYKLLYLAPESLNSNKIILTLKRIKISRIVIDEAHCISEWGHDFRPDYNRIINILSKIERRLPLVALTATANKETIEDIKKVLNLSNPFISISTFERENLYLGIKNFWTRFGKFNFLKKKILESNKILIYCSTREETKELSNKISKKLNIKSSFYHAGCSTNERKLKQEQFKNNEIKILCATNAFGMGIDIPDIDTVIYFGFPSSIEDYYQGIGRAGRNPDIKAKSWVLYLNSDIKQQKNIIFTKLPKLKELKLILKDIINDYDKEILKEKYKIGESIINSIIILSEENQDSNKIFEKLNILSKRKLEKFLALKKFIFSKSCKKKNILEYFGEKFEYEKCNNCSICNDNIVKSKK